MSFALFQDESDKTSCPSDVYDEAYQYNYKSKSNNSKKKKPKRNRSAFIIFSSEMRTKLRNDHHEKLNSNEMMVKLAELWKNLAEDRKKKFYDQAEKEKVRYHNDLNYFYQNYPEEIIHNKTRKNHIKKPCSAYALYLKEMKNEIKLETPDLKMADILKVVGERWKNLSDDLRIIYQRKAQAEKELTKAKLSEAMNSPIEESPKPKKSTQSKKRSNPAKKNEKSSQETVKVEQPENEVKVEEPTVLKKQQLSDFSIPAPLNYTPFPPNFNFANFFASAPNPLYMSHNNSFTGNITNTNSFVKPVNSSENIEYTVPDFPYFSNPFSKLPSSEPMLLSKYSSRDESRYDREPSQMWNIIPDSTFNKKPSEFIDLMSFQSCNKGEPLLDFIKKEDDYSESEDEYLASTATNLTPSSSLAPHSNRAVMNRALCDVLMEPIDFSFEPLNLDNTFDNFLMTK